MKAKGLLTTCLLVLSLGSCNTKSELEKEIEAVNKECGFRLNSKIEDFPASWHGTVRRTNEKFQFKETRDDGVDVYTCGTYDYLTTEFYFRDGLEVGLKTRDPQFGFSIFGRYLGAPIWSIKDSNYKDLISIFSERSYDYEPDGHRDPDVLPNGYIYSWVTNVYKNKLHINYSWEPIYTFDGSLTEIEVFLDK